MRSLGVVVVQPRPDLAMGIVAGRKLPQIDALVLQRPPQPLDKDIVHPATLAVHRDAYPGVAQHVGEVLAGKLTPLVGVEDLRCPVVRQRLFKRLDTKA